MPELPTDIKSTDDIAVIDYTNHRGERAKRVIVPIRIWFGTSAYHDGQQWFLDALDLAKGESRDFALAGLHSWRAVFDDDRPPTAQGDPD